MASPQTTSPASSGGVAAFLKNNLREYGLMIALVVIMVFFQAKTDGTLFQPLNLTNLILQNSYIIVMALGMLLVIVPAILTSRSVPSAVLWVLWLRCSW